MRKSHISYNIHNKLMSNIASERKNAVLGELEDCEADYLKKLSAHRRAEDVLRKKREQVEKVCERLRLAILGESKNQ